MFILVCGCFLGGSERLRWSRLTPAVYSHVWMNPSTKRRSKLPWVIIAPSGPFPTCPDDRLCPCNLILVQIRLFSDSDDQSPEVHVFIYFF